MVSKIRFKNFKLFKNWQELEIKPITILIGKNNSGKTAVLKLPAMISAGFKGEDVKTSYKVGLDSSNIIDLGTHYKDLIYKKNEAGFLSFELGIEDKKIEISINQNEILEYKVNDVEIDFSNAKGFLAKDLNLKGFEIDYISGIRILPEYNYNYSKLIDNKIGVKGQNTYQILIEDHISNSDSIVEKISNWYNENFEGWEIEVEEHKRETQSNFEVVIKNDELSAINIKQSGQGISQVLPLITRSFMHDDEPILICIEEPESHLHPAAHGNLAERFVDSYLEDNNKRYLIETHSQNFVLRLRRLVAEGKLKHEELAIYYVDFLEDEYLSELKEIEVDKLGKVNYWPEGIFSETLEETMALRDAQFKK